MPDIKDTVFYALLDIAKTDRNVILLSCDYSAYAFSEFPESQFFNVGIAEQNAMSVAVGLALEGKRVFVAGIINFVTMRCLEQIKMDICIHAASVCILGIGAGYSYSGAGPSHHAVEDVAIMRVMPGMTIYNPSSYKMAAAMVKSAYDMKVPCYIRMDKEPLLVDDYSDLKDGYRIVRRGQQYIATTGTGVQIALKENGLGIVDIYRLKPAPSFPEVVQVLDEHSPIGGLLSLVSEQAYYAGSRTCVDGFRLEVGSRDYMRKLDGLKESV
jgi:transketolase